MPKRRLENSEILIAVTTKRLRNATDYSQSFLNNLKQDSISVPNESNDIDMEIDVSTNPVEISGINNSRNENHISEEDIRIIRATIDVTIAQVHKINDKIRIIEEKFRQNKCYRKLDKTVIEPLAVNANISNIAFPIDSINNVIAFESNLKDRAYKMLTVSSFNLLKYFIENELKFILIYKQISLMTRKMGLHLKKSLETLVYELIAPAVFSKYTWTGKTLSKDAENQHERKIKKEPFKVFIRIHDVLYRIMKCFNPNYTQSQFEFDLKYKVIKTAYRNAL